MGIVSSAQLVEGDLGGEGGDEVEEEGGKDGGEGYEGGGRDEVEGGGDVKDKIGELEEEEFRE